MARRRKACDFCEDDNYGDYIEHRMTFVLASAMIFGIHGCRTMIGSARKEKGKKNE